MAANLTAHHHHSNAIAPGLSEPLFIGPRSPLDRRLSADQIAKARQQAADISGPVRQIERLMAAGRCPQHAGMGMIPGSQFIE
jgi:hypothetical protein